MAEANTGIAGSQKKQESSATKARGSQRSSLRRVAPYVIGIVAILFPLLLLWKIYVEKPSEPTLPKASGVLEQPLAAPTVGKAAPNGVDRRVLTVSDSSWSDPIRVPAGRCYREWVEKFDSPASMAQIAVTMRPSEGDWKDNTGYVRAVYWLRVKSEGPGPTEVIVELRPDGQCS